MTPLVSARVNGEDRGLPADATVSDVVALFTRTSTGVAVALNGEVVPKSEWSLVRLADGDAIEVLGVAAGG